MNIKPKKLIRTRTSDNIKPEELELITDQEELNKLYALKVREELLEIQNSDHKDISEFVDLIQVVFSFAKVNGFEAEEISKGILEKSLEKGLFKNTALINLNPSNPSNKLYYDKENL